ncbi:hypothetical protein LWI29_025402 [Acer saccharum]|uniref:Uncharacterized protein n=1 Tax=Acer saccharum TaxID=4024 RepID=A0AA39VJW7_ACESA|nr:hypothetical protein LWI29_025402 [Acer saccharum]
MMDNPSLHELNLQPPSQAVLKQYKESVNGIDKAVKRFRFSSLLVSDSIRLSFVVETQGQINEERSQETKTESPEVAALPVQEPVADDFQGNETQISDNGK